MSVFGGYLVGCGDKVASLRSSSDSGVLSPEIRGWWVWYLGRLRGGVQGDEGGRRAGSGMRLTMGGGRV